MKWFDENFRWLEPGDSFFFDKPRCIVDYILCGIAVFLPIFILLNIWDNDTDFYFTVAILGWTVCYGSWVFYRLWKIDEDFRNLIYRIIRRGK